ncbi:MAG: glycosyltransferase family 2 protein [Gammaproteobacteria bacterium]|nr:glycosyltransferase family 2 protein [Gammaproteobacteria bacterium]
MKASEFSPSILVVIPAYNEQDTIERVIEETRFCGPRLQDLGFDLHICVVDDGSTDATADVARHVGVDHLIAHRLNRGLGAAVRSGLECGRSHDYDIVVKLDADGQHDPRDIPDLIHPIANDEADVVYGNRFPRMTYRMPLVRRIGNALFRSLMRQLTQWDIVDSQPGIVALSKTYLQVFSIAGDYNYTQQILVDAYHKGMRYDQVPVAFKERTSGHSFVSMKYPFLALYQIVMTLILARPLRVFLPIASVFLGGAGLVVVTELILWMNGIGEKPVEHVNLVLGLTILGVNTGYFGVLAELVVRHRS